MIKRTPTRVAVATLLIASLFSCRKETEVGPNAVVPNNPLSQDIQAHYSFDWDNPNTTTMPVSSQSPVVYVPWRSNGGTPLDADIVNDYHKIDGWDLVFDSFSPDNFPRPGNTGAIATSNALPAGGLYFALYNRYRGILRYYLYTPPGLFGSSTQLDHGLSSYAKPSNTRMLNFEAGDIASATAHAEGFTKTNKDGISVTGGWYVMQYQLAYDPQFATTTFPGTGFKWDTYTVSVNQIKLNGKEIGTSKGTITTPKPDFDWSNAIVNGGLAVIEAFGLGGPKVVADIAQGALAGNVTNFLSGVFSSRSSSQQTVDLEINSNIETSGSSTGQQPYELNSMPFPGQNSGQNGVTPLATYSLGLFNLSAPPTVTADVYTYPVSGGGGGGTTFPGGGGGGLDDQTEYDFYYTIDPAAVRALVQLNPDVFNNPDPAKGADFNDFKAEVVALDPDPNYTPAGVNKAETIGIHRASTGTPYIRFAITSSSYMQPGPPTNSLAVRVSFIVHPHNGSADQLIVKTFSLD